MKRGIFWLFQNFKIQNLKIFGHVTYFSVIWPDPFLNDIAIDVNRRNGPLPIIFRFRKWKKWVSAYKSHFELDIGGAADAITTFLLITSDREEIQMRAWSHCVQRDNTVRMICIFTYFDPTWPLGHVTWGQILNLTFRGQHTYISMRLDERNTMAFEFWRYLFPFKTYERKTAWSFW